jgi:hypothetical protein
MSFLNASESIYQTVWPRINFNMSLLPSKKEMDLATLMADRF